MVGLLAGLDETRAIARRRAQPVLHHRKRSHRGRAAGRPPGEVLQSNDLPLRQETLVALFGHQPQAFLQGEPLRQRNAERNQDLRAPVPRAFPRTGSRLDGLPNPARGFLADLFPALPAMQLRKVRPEHFHVIAYLGHSADRRTARLDRVALLDGDGRRNAFDAIHARLVHAIEELARIGRKRLDIPALPLGKKRVKGKGTLA